MAQQQDKLLQLNNSCSPMEPAWAFQMFLYLHSCANSVKLLVDDCLLHVWPDLLISSCWNRSVVFLHPIHQNKFRLSTFLQTRLNVFMLRLFVSSDSFFSSVSWQRYAYALVTFRQRKHLVRVRKRPGFGLKYLALSPQTQQQIFCHLVKNCAFFCCQKHDWNEFFPERYLFVLPSCTSATVPSASLVLTKLLKFVRFYSLPKAGRGKVTRILLKLLRLLEQQRLGLLRCLWWVDGLQVCERQALQPIRKAPLWENTTESIIMTTSFCSGNLAAFWGGEASVLFHFQSLDTALCSSAVAFNYSLS